MKDKREKAPWWFYVLFLLILSTFLMRDRFQNSNMILIPVVLAMLLGLGVLLVAGIRQWRKPDEEVLEGFFPMADLFSGPVKGDLKTHAGNFLRTAVFMIAFMVITSYRNGKIPVPFLIFMGIILLALGLPMLRLWLVKDSKEDSGRPYKAAAFIALLLGIATTGFICFWIGIGIYHGVWWFTLPPGIPFFIFFSRNLAAGIRYLVKCRKPKDPWDDLDRGL